jgi:hypothetical protein
MAATRRPVFAIIGIGCRLPGLTHGHKHRRYGPMSLDGVRYIAHPFGYPRRHERPEDGLRVFELNGDSSG